MQRFVPAVIALLATMGLPLAEGAAISLAPVSIADPLQHQLDSRYGTAEAAVLRRAVKESLARALQSAGAAIAPNGVAVVEVTLEEATPSHPTSYQSGRNPAIDRQSSVSLGGAMLTAVLRGAQGQVIDRVSVRRYARNLAEVSNSPDPWADARRAIDILARRVALSCRQHQLTRL